MNLAGDTPPQMAVIPQVAMSASLPRPQSDVAYDVNYTLPSNTTAHFIDGRPVPLTTKHTYLFEMFKDRPSARYRPFTPRGTLPRRVG